MKVITLRLVVTCCILIAAPATNAQTRVTGWRGDGSGRYVKVQPPSTWSKDSDNIVWQLDVGSGFSSPVLNAGRLFLTVQPSDVICIDPETGHELWRESSGYESAYSSQEADRIAAVQADFDAEVRDAARKYNELKKQDPDSTNLEQLKQQRKEIENRRRDFQRKFPPEKRGGAGNGAATVVCDGSNVYAVFGTGIVSAFTVDGKRLWTRHIEAPQQGFGHSASPVFAGGHLVVHIQKLTALDPNTGATRWQADLPAKFGTPAVASIAKQDVIITPSGSVVAAEDGRVLADKLFQLSNNSPLVQEDVIYAHESGKVKAFRLPKSMDEPFEPALLWENSSTRDQRMASALFHDGLLYAAGRRGIFDVTDARTGESVYRKRLDIGDLFSSPIMAGDLIYFGGREGKLCVFRPGREFDEVGLNTIGRVSSIPAFQGNRLYLRTDRVLVCIESR